MQSALISIGIYTIILALSQIFLKIGVSQIGGFKINSLADIFALVPTILSTPLLLLGIALMGSSFFFWMYILSWFKLSLVFPLTAMTYVFVAILAGIFLGEKLLWINYLGIVLIAAGIGFLVYK